MKKALLILAGFLLSQGLLAAAEPLLPLAESRAYERYVQRPPSELSKLIYLLDRYKDTDIKVIYDGNEYNGLEAANYAKKYLSKHYNRKDDAEKWLKIHAYRSNPGGNIIYFKFTDDERRPMLDVLLEELQSLENTRALIK